MNKPRYLALDCMRGLTLAAMILVNTPGSWSHVYAPLLHADWHGATPTDFVFPFFLFIVGSAMVFSQRSQSALSRSAQSLKILRRTVILFAIGVFLNYYPFKVELESLRVLGVLQRIALAYAICAFMIMLPFKLRMATAVAIAALYWLLYALPNYDYSLANNPVRQLDVMLLGAQHLWQGKGIAFDPEGLLSTLPAALNVLAGYEITRLIIQGNSKIILGIAGVVMIAVALLWHPLHPINKSLWTSSFALLSAGVATLVLLLLIQLEKLSALAKPFKAFATYGENPLFIYVLSWLWVASYSLININGQTPGSWLYQSLGSFTSALNASLIYALLHVLLFWLIALFLHKKKIRISV